MWYKVLDVFTEEEQKEYEKLQWLERFWKLTWKQLPKHVEDKLEEYRYRLRESVRDEEANVLWMSESELEKPESELEKPESEESLDVNQELKEYRDLWKRNIKNISDDSKKKIIRAVDSIPIKVEVDRDGSRLIEFKLWNKTYKILDPRLEKHTDDEYRRHLKWSSVTEIDKDYVKIWWMRGDNVEEWKNEKLKEYVKGKQREWLHISKKQEMHRLIHDLWSMADLWQTTDNIAMLMYLTWLDWYYRLDMSDEYEPSYYRSEFACLDSARHFHYGGYEGDSSSLCMMSCS